MSSYPMLEPMGFDTDIYDGVEKLGQPLFWEILSASINKLKPTEVCPHKLKLWAYCCNTSFWHPGTVFDSSNKQSLGWQNVYPFVRWKGGK